jgi:hypothetical protein
MNYTGITNGISTIGQQVNILVPQNLFGVEFTVGLRKVICGDVSKFIYLQSKPLQYETNNAPSIYITYRIVIFICWPVA